MQAQHEAILAVALHTDTVWAVADVKAPLGVVKEPAIRGS